jgi:hypothetical protein
MGIVGGFDIHRRQITFDHLDERSGETRHGRIAPADRMLLGGWLEHLLADTGTSAAFAVEGCTGWRFVVEELQRAGAQAHLAEPARCACRARAETAGQDRPRQRPAAAGPARRRPAAQVMDSAAAGAGDAREASTVQGPAGRAHRTVGVVASPCAVT